MPQRVYADWNATAPLRPQARDAMMAVFGPAVNPSSVHTEGRAARRIVDDARAQVAALVGATPQQVVFTGGGTEANALALSPALRPAGRRVKHSSGWWCRRSNIRRCCRAGGSRRMRSPRCR